MPENPTVLWASTRPGRDHRGFEQAEALRHGDLAGHADGRDLAVLNHHHAVLIGGPAIVWTVLPRTAICADAVEHEQRDERRKASRRRTCFRMNSFIAHLPACMLSKQHEIGRLRTAGAESADGVQVIARVAAIEDLHAVDPGFERLAVDAQRIAVQDGEVGVLAGLERADAILQAEHFGSGQRQRSQGSGPRHAGPHGQGRRCGGRRASR